jgi:hypothetical protein
MTCFTREELWEHVGGLVFVVVPFVAACLILFGWALAVLARSLTERPDPGRRRARRRRAPLRVLAHPDHNPDRDGVLSPPAEEDL